MKGYSSTLILKNSALELNKVENLVEALADKYYLNDSYFANIMVALTEAFNNARIHGNRNDASKSITIDFSMTGKEMIFEVTDEGQGFDFQAFLNGTQLRENKRGLDLIQSVSDKIEFSDNGKRIAIHFNVASVNQNISQNRMSAFTQQTEEKTKKEDEIKRH